MTLLAICAFDYSVPGVDMRRWKLFMYFVIWGILRLNKEGVTWAVGVSTCDGPDCSGFELGGRDKLRIRLDRPQGSPSFLHSGYRR
jgi:hypothetical protein